jgi:hypothetical protein
LSPETRAGLASTQSFEAAAGGFGRRLRQSPVRPALTCDLTADASFPWSCGHDLRWAPSQTVIELIAATTTRTGLKVYARLDENAYPDKIKITDDQLAQVQTPRRNVPPRMELHHQTPTFMLIRHGSLAPRAR